MEYVSAAVGAVDASHGEVVRLRDSGSNTATRIGPVRIMVMLMTRTLHGTLLNAVQVLAHADGTAMRMTQESVEYILSLPVQGSDIMGRETDCS